MDIKKELTENQTILLVMDSGDYSTTMVDIAKQLSSKKLCYVTLNKTHDSLVELFRKNKIDPKNIYFVDAISRTFKRTAHRIERCSFVSSPGALTELFLTIAKIMDRGYDYLIFDSVTNLAIYEKKGPIIKFISTLVNKAKDSKVNAVFYSFKGAEHEALNRELGTFVDKTL